MSINNNDGTFHSCIDAIQYEYTKIGRMLSAETYRADTAEGEAFATNLQLVQALAEIETIKAQYRGREADLNDYITATHKRLSSIAKELESM